MYKIKLKDLFLDKWGREQSILSTEFICLVVDLLQL